MACLSCHCISKSFVHASLNPQNDASSSTPPSHSKPKSKTRTPRRSLETKIQQQLSLMEIERAIGAGSYRDSDTPDSKPRDSILKGLLPNSAGNFETPVEKKLRETGEWVTVTAEGKFQASGKKILMFFLKLVLPIYIVMFLVTSGTVKLPWSTPFLEDMLM
ncbi:probable NAD(P)H dehydrogenase subunit CRR3, chloroplastic [Euphorbia lathyris]|uniref:probable NAD(P)H dehydrogenase subunit CRR3, chloroplastic n=1 Tax=Euphorbia lathyris TaxID=212925 RepID=UPI003313E8A0